MKATLQTPAEGTAIRLFGELRTGKRRRARGATGTRTTGAPCGTASFELRREIPEQRVVALLE